MSGPAMGNSRQHRKGRVGAPPYKKPRFSLSGSVLWGLSILSFFLFVQAVAKENAFLNAPDWLSKWKVLSAEAATTLLVGFATLMVARRQFALTIKPILSVSISALDGGDDDDKKILLDRVPTHWQATLHNRGSGMATIKKLNYFVRYRKDHQIVEAELKRDELFDLLIQHGFVESKDFRIPRIVEEATIESQATVLLFAYNKAIFHAFWIEGQFEYASVLGDWYLKDVPCLSHESPLKPASD
jgi:hypothetical protein